MLDCVTAIVCTADDPGMMGRILRINSCRRVKQVISVSIAAISLISWLVTIVFAMVPKKFTLTEMVFLYFVSSILTVATFTTFDINLQWVVASRNVEKSLALHVCRFVEIPLLLILSSEALHSPLSAIWRWTIAAAICTFLTVNDWILVQFGILMYRQWNYAYAFLEFGLFIILVAWIARWFVGLERRGLRQP